MRSSTSPLFSIPLLLSTVAAISSIDCKQNVIVDGRKFDFSKLDSPHAIWHKSEDKPPSISNTTWSVNICHPLPVDKKKPNYKEDQCSYPTNVCGVVRTWNPSDDPDKEHVAITEVIPVAGADSHSSGHTLDPKWTRLKTMDSEKEGLQLELFGAKYDGLKQKAVIEFQCYRGRTGNKESTGKLGKEGKTNGKRADAEDEEDDSDQDLTFVSYGPVEGKKEIMQVLRLNWKTKYACEDYEDDGAGKSRSWGFFTWFILIAFLGIAAYLIFGSWLNYNRYGARGWDLLPHGDTIRDIPYLMKDWGRKVVDTVSGPGSRGGYSAV